MRLRNDTAKNKKTIITNQIDKLKKYNLIKKFY